VPPAGYVPEGNAPDLRFRAGGWSFRVGFQISKGQKIIRMIDKGSGHFHWTKKPSLRSPLLSNASEAPVSEHRSMTSLTALPTRCIIWRRWPATDESSSRPTRQPSDEELRTHSRITKKTVRVSMSQNAAIETMLKMAPDQNSLTIYKYRSWNLERDAEAAFVTADSPLSLWSSNPPGRVNSRRDDISS
jgi:hypothetical protein